MFRTKVVEKNQAHMLRQIQVCRYNYDDDENFEVVSDKRNVIRIWA
jgi:hypothetical protein